MKYENVHQTISVCMACEYGSEAHQRVLEEHPEWACWSYIDWNEFGLGCEHLLHKCNYSTINYCRNCKHDYEERLGGSM